MSGGGGGGGGLSKLGLALVVIFVISLLAIFAALFYVLWRRRVFLRRTSPPADTAFPSIAPSKELLYFFYVRPQSCLDRSSLTADSGGNQVSSNQSDMAVIDIDLLKIQGVFGAPRFMFTVKEEEKEGMESPAKRTLVPAETEMKKNIDDENRGGGLTLVECFQSQEDAAEVETEDESVDDDATPFSTPCASPVYFTPSASPVREVVNGRSTQAKLTSQGGNHR